MLTQARGSEQSLCVEQKPVMSAMMMTSSSPSPLNDTIQYVDLRGAEALARYPRALADWYNIMLESFPNPNEFDQLESFQRMLLSQAPYDNETASHLFVCLRGDSEVLGGIHFEYHPNCKSALLAYVVVSAKTRGMGIGKKLFDTAVQMLEAAHPELEAIFAETHGMSVEDGVYPTAHRQKYFADLGFMMVDVPYITPILPGRATPCFDYLLIVRPCRAARLADKPTGIRTSMLRLFVSSYWQYVSRHLYPTAADSPYFNWVAEHGLDDCEEVYSHGLLSYTTADTEDDFPPGLYTPLLETPWDFTLHTTMLEDFIFAVDAENKPTRFAELFVANDISPCSCTDCAERFQEVRRTILASRAAAADDVSLSSSSVHAGEEDDSEEGGVAEESDSPRSSGSSTCDDVSVVDWDE